MIKAIFFDIDGTLIGNGTHTLAESTREAIRGARSNGHICIVNIEKYQLHLMHLCPFPFFRSGY